MKTVAFAGPGKMELREAPDPTPAAGEVAIDVSHCGICGADLHEYASHGPSMRAAGLFQPVMGHEFTGTIAAVGAGDVSSLISRTVSLDALPATFEQIAQDRNRDQKVLVRP